MNDLYPMKNYSYSNDVAITVLSSRFISVFDLKKTKIKMIMKIILLFASLD
jgi:hypothetical protein